jgi:hypothetical protein
MPVVTTVITRAWVATVAMAVIFGSSVARFVFKFKERSLQATLEGTCCHAMAVAVVTAAMAVTMIIVFVTTAAITSMPVPVVMVVLVFAIVMATVASTT